MAKWAGRSVFTTAAKPGLRCRGDVFLAPAYGYQPPVTAEEAPGTIISVAIMTINRPTMTGTDVRFTTSNGDILAIPATATTTPETGEIVRPGLRLAALG